MSMESAKGAEFDHVFVLGLSTAANARAARRDVAPCPTRC